MAETPEGRINLAGILIGSVATIGAATIIGVTSWMFTHVTQNSETIQKILARQEVVIERLAVHEKTMEELEKRIRDLEKFQYNFSYGMRKDPMNGH